MYGDGSLKETKIGSYRYWTVRFYDNEGKQKAKRFPYTDEGKRQAKKFQNEIHNKKKSGVLVSCTHTVQSWTREYIDTYKINSLKDSSLERLIQTYNLIEVSRIANISLDKLNGSQVQGFYNQLSDTWTDSKGKAHKKLSSSSISKVHKLLVSAYKKAVQLRMITVNPMDTVDPVKVTTKEMSVFTWREIGKIFRAIRKYDNYKFNNSQTHDYRLLFRMLLKIGCRVGELLALQWQDIDLKKREIHIHSTKAMNGQFFNDPKTKAGNRYVPILDNKLLEMLKDYRKKCGIIKINGYVFENKNGGAISYQRVFLTWQRISGLAGIKKNIHTFRHTAATYLLERGVPVAEVSRILGHADATITYKMYVHAIPGYNQRLIEMFQPKKLETSTKTSTN